MEKTPKRACEWNFIATFAPNTRIGACRCTYIFIRKKITMKRILQVLLIACCPMLLWAQSDPVVMTINGQPVPRSEFEYSYNKNNSEGVIDKKSVDDYVDLFINYKLKVLAAKEAGIDTTTAFKKEFATYRDQQVRPTLITDADVEKEAEKIYKETQQRVDNNGGLIKPAHIFLPLKQNASVEEQKVVKDRMDSLYQALQKGASFAELAKKYSKDGTAANGGELPWIEHGQTFKEFETNAYALKVGQMSKPFTTPAGWHIVKLNDRRNFFPYDSVKTDIIRFIDQNGFRERIIDNKLNDMAKASGDKLTKEDILQAKTAELAAKDSDMKYLIQEYHDGLLLYEISNRTVWEKASKDETALQHYYNANRKNYRWDQPRFKGIAYHTRDKADIKAVKNAIKNKPFNQWAEVLRSTFNNDSILRIRVEKGIFKQGDNKLVDNQIFKTGAKVEKVENYPFDAVYGKKLKGPESLDDVRAQVVADYQESLEKEWIDSLRKKYPVTINKEVLATVNKH